MAIDSFECRIITGGFNHCDSSWNKTTDELDRCFKIYHPVKGMAKINVNGTEYTIQAGYIYFISGYHIESQRCSNYMDIYWLHFIPSSLYLKHILLSSKPVFLWDEKKIPFMENFNDYVYKLFKGNFKSTNIKILPYSYEEAKIQSYILHFIAEILKETPKEELSTSDEIKRLTQSIQFMNNEYTNNPALKDIAAKSNFAPNYFHRIFKKNFDLTPYGYMLRLRMEHAIKLLTTTDKTVKEVAYECGYANEFYFHRQFKKHYNYSPGEMRKIKPF